MITVLCVRISNRYGPEYVERLRNMVSRHLTVPYEFVCLTDQDVEIEGVRNILIGRQNYSRLWWHKVHMFDPGLGIRNRILYFDLDVVIHNNLDKLVKNETENFYGIRDFNRKFHKGWKRLNSSVMSWIGGNESDIWENFKKDSEQVMRKYPGDQDWIWATANDRIKFWADDWIQSYKWEIRFKDELTLDSGRRNFKDVREPFVSPACSVAVFHGDPKPDDVKDRFVVDNWK